MSAPPLAWRRRSVEPAALALLFAGALVAPAGALRVALALVVAGGALGHAFLRAAWPPRRTSDDAAAPLTPVAYAGLVVPLSFALTATIALVLALTIGLRESTIRVAIGLAGLGLVAIILARDRRGGAPRPLVHALPPLVRAAPHRERMAVAALVVAVSFAALVVAYSFATPRAGSSYASLELHPADGLGQLPNATSVHANVSFRAVVGGPAADPTLRLVVTTSDPNASLVAGQADRPVGPGLAQDYTIRFDAPGTYRIAVDLQGRSDAPEGYHSAWFWVVAR